MNETELLVGASIHLCAPLVEAQDPHGEIAEGQALRDLISVAWHKLQEGSAPSLMWVNLLNRLAGEFDEYMDESSEGEDFLVLAAGQVGMTFGMLLASRVDVDTLWQELTTTFAVLDRYLGRGGAEPFFAGWLVELRGALSKVAEEADEDEVAARARQLLDQEITQARPFFSQAYRASVADGDG